MDDLSNVKFIYVYLSATHRGELLSHLQTPLSMPGNPRLVYPEVILGIMSDHILLVSRVFHKTD